MQDKIKAVIFDMDGVIINSEPYWVKAETKIFKEVGVDFLALENHKTVGLRIDEVVHYWYKKLQWKGLSSDEIVSKIIQEMVHNIRLYGESLPGLIEVLKALKSKNILIGLASSSPSILIEETLKKLNIKQYFDHIQSAEKLNYGKPHPEVYITTAKNLNIDPLECLVIEDSLNGIIAGKAAKMTVVAIPDGTHKTSEQYKVADYQFNNLLDFKRSLLDAQPKASIFQ